VLRAGCQGSKTPSMPFAAILAEQLLAAELLHVGREQRAVK